MMMENPSNNNNNNNVSYLNALRIEDTFRRVFHIFGNQWVVFITISGLAVGLHYFLDYITSVVNGTNNVDVETTMEGQQELSAIDSWATLCFYIVDLGVFYLAMCLGDGANIRAVSEIYVGQTPTWIDSIGTAAQHLVQLLGSCLLVNLVILFPAFLLIVLIVSSDPGEANPFLFALFVLWVVAIYVSLVTYHMYPAIIIENESITGSISRSFCLSKGYLCHIFGILLLFQILKFFVSTPATIMIVSASKGAQITGKILSIILNVVFSALGSIFKAVVYFDIRVKKEGFNHETLMREMGLEGTPYSNMETQSNPAEKDTVLAGGEFA